MSDHRSLALQYAHAHKEEFLASLKELVAIPSVSTDPERAGDVQRAAQWIAARLTSLGMEQVQIFQTARHPVVYGEWLHAANAPTVLIYGHYDVQPVDPLDLWKTGPFEPTMVGDNLYGRGASDMKGQDLVVLSAVESIIKTGTFPINIKWVIEGEEEIGSPNLASFIAEHKDLLKCDFALNTDSGLIGADHPSVTYGLRGLAYFEVHVQGPAGDLHSGTFGGGVHNPAIVLAELIAGMHDDQGRITWPGFYDQVRPLSEKERAEFARLPITDESLQRVTGAPQVYGEAGFTSAERISARPTLDVNGLLSGFTGAGQKTVLPAKAMAKLSTRLVPDQDPQAIHKGLVAYMEQHAPQTVKWEVKMLGGGPAALVNLDNPGVVAMSKALEVVWNQKAMYKREGGSIPVVVQMQKLLGIESVICGFGLPDDNLHAPNEKQHLPTWYRGIDTLIHFYFNLV